MWELGPLLVAGLDLSICLSVYLSICLSIYLSIHLSLYRTPQIGGVGGTRALAHSIYSPIINNQQGFSTAHVPMNASKRIALGSQRQHPWCSRRRDQNPGPSGNSPCTMYRDAKRESSWWYETCGHVKWIKQKKLCGGPGRPDQHFNSRKKIYHTSTFS